MTTSVATRYEQTLAEIKRLSLAGLEGPELLGRVAERLRLAVPFDTYGASTLDPATNLMTHFVGAGLDEEDCAAALDVWVDRVYFEEDLFRIASMLRDRRPVELLSETPGRELERSARYGELLRPFGLAHELGGIFVDGSAWGRMDLVREAGNPNFGDREVELVRRVASYVGAGLKAAVLRSRASIEPAIDEPPGVLTLDRDGRALSHTPSAERLLSELRKPDPPWAGLPVAVGMVASTVQRALAPASDRDSNLVPKVRVRTRSGHWLTLHGSLTEPTPGRPSETVVVIEPTKPEEVAWLNVTAYGLSPREEEVVKLAVRGLSNRQISRTLFISENTVQRHLSNIFEKVGVRSRRELIKRLFFENLLPGMLGD